MATKKKSWNSYEDYLNSPEWEKIRAAVHKRDKGVCQLCGCPEASNPHCHHWNYPSDWNEDTPDNVILACDGCHSDLHELGFEPSQHDTYPAYLRAYSEFVVAKEGRGNNIEVIEKLMESDSDLESAVGVIASLTKELQLSICKTILVVSDGEVDPQSEEYSISGCSHIMNSRVGAMVIDELRSNQ